MNSFAAGNWEIILPDIWRSWAVARQGRSQLRHQSILTLPFAILLSLFLAAAAGAVERIGWEDLAPVWEEPDDPLEALSLEQQDALLDIFWVRNLKDAGNTSDELAVREDKARQTLIAAGVDVDALVAKIETLQELYAAQDQVLVEELDGKEVQIPGFALPLEFSGTLMTEFLLVPYVGACIHTPPPPANQIVHVRADAGYESEGLFTPVWVTGRISTTPSSQSLSFVDGSSDVDVGYALRASEIEPYEE